MDWIEIKLSVDGEAAEAITDLLQRYGHQGVAVEQEGVMPVLWEDGDVPPPEKLTVRAYIPDDEFAAGAKAQLETALRHMDLMYPMPKPVYSVIKETDWAEAWKAHYHPVRIGRRILIRPLWVDVQPGPNDVVITLDPGMAFGTGTHPSTQLCLVALEELIIPGARVLDLGCGSGILSIAAAKLGASSVLGLDTDPIAVKVSQENARINDVADRVLSQVGSLNSLISSSRRFDLIVVNILATVIIEMCSQGLGQVVRPGGLAILSGIIEDQAEDVEAALSKSGLQPHARRQQADWVEIEARRPH